jgi:type II secretory pathway pseudopilin PulG
MIEIAICLAIIGIALVSIIGVLPMGLNVQKDNREETIINQDATVFMEYIRNGASSPYGSDLTNYVYAITNFQTRYNNPGVTTTVPTPGWDNNTYLTNNARIIGLLSTPEYIATDGTPLNNILNVNYYSNHIVACVRSVSGPASEKPLQDNGTILSGSFSYKIICENVPLAVNTPPLWQALSYNAGDQVYWLQVYWQATAATLAADVPGSSTKWGRVVPYAQQLAANLHELRLTFLWPLLPNGKTGNGRQTFRTTVAGQIVQTIDTNVIPNQTLYFFQPQSFMSAP